MFSCCTNPTRQTSSHGFVGSCLDKSLTKSLLVGLGLIIMIGGLAATGYFFSSMGYASLSFASAGIALGLAPIILVSCQRPHLQEVSPERRTLFLNYHQTNTPASVRAFHSPGHPFGMSDFSIIPHDIVEQVRSQTFDTKTERSIGIMLGGTVGDVLGAPFKNKSFQETGYTRSEVQNFNLQMGQWTDETSLSLCLADILITGPLNEAQLMWAFYDWAHHAYNTPFTKGNYIGPAARIDLSHALMIFENRHYSRSFNESSLPVESNICHRPKNGSLSRCGPVAIVARSADEARLLARRQSKVTHTSEEVAACCELLSFIIYEALHDSDDDPEIIKHNLIQKIHSYNSTNQKVNSFARHQSTEGRGSRNEIIEEDWDWLNDDFLPSSATSAQFLFVGQNAIDALAIALNCIFTTSTCENAVTKAATRGGDSDAIGAIAGMIAGAIYGRNAIPQNWVDAVQNWDRGGEIAARGYMLSRELTI